MTGRIELPYAAFIVPKGFCYGVRRTGIGLNTPGGGSTLIIDEVEPDFDCGGVAKNLGDPTRLADSLWGGQRAEGYKLANQGQADNFFYCATSKGVFYTLYGGTATHIPGTTEAPDTANLAIKELFASWQWK